MANYGTLKAAIEAAIRTNGQQLITGQSLQTQLVNMVTALGKFFQSYGGVVTSASTFTAGDENVLFFATEAGTYTDFGGAVLDGKTLHILYYDSSWHDADTSIPSGAAFEAALALAIKGAQSGIAEGIADTISAGTAQEFLQRQSGGDGVNCIKRIKGKTIAWNQLGTMAKISTTTQSGVTLTKNADGSITISAENTVETLMSFSYPSYALSGWRYPAHRYFLGATGNDKVRISLYRDGGYGVDPAATTAPVIVSSLTSAQTVTGFRIEVLPGFVGSVTFVPMLIDLTLLNLGDLSADQFRALYPELDYAFNAGVLKSNDAAALLTDGFNQWDGNVFARDKVLIASNGVLYDNPGRSVTGWIPVIAGQVYYFTGAFGINGATAGICFYDSQKNFLSGITTPENNEGFTRTIPAGAAFMRASYLSASEGTACISLSDASFNGTYEPYWQRVLALRITELTGIPEGGTEADRVTMFPEGAAGAGSAFDSIFVENGVTKARKTMLAEIDLGDLNYDYNADYKNFYATLQGKKEGVDNLICPKFAFTPLPLDGNQPDKSIKGGSTNTRFFISDFAYTDAATFKAAMAGVKLLAEAATPIVYTDLQYADGTPFTMPATILVDNYGTERIQAPEGATTPSAPFCCDSNYSIGVANLVKRLAALENAE